MPVTKSAKKALRVADRRHTENLISKYAYKKAVKTVRKAVSAGEEGIVDLFQKAQSSLDRAANTNAIHPNKAARLKSRLFKTLSNTPSEPTAKTSKTTRTSSSKTAKKSVRKTSKK